MTPAILPDPVHPGHRISGHRISGPGSPDPSSLDPGEKRSPGARSGANVPRVTARLHALTQDVRDPGLVAAFWGQLLGRGPVPDGDALLLPGTPTQVGLRFGPGGPAAGADENRIHLHVTSETEAGQRHTVQRALDLGGSHLDVGQLPEERHIVLADPEGNPFCVIEAGNNFLAGCGVLGELACDGTRDVGLFWAAALDWPLVWDQNEETAVQAPEGGTKVAWGGPPVLPQRGQNIQRFDLRVEGDLGPEIDRLVALGASVCGEPGPDAAELADPDGNEFVLTRA